MAEHVDHERRLPASCSWASSGSAGAASPALRTGRAAPKVPQVETLSLADSVRSWRSVGLLGEGAEVSCVPSPLLGVRAGNGGKGGSAGARDETKTDHRHINEHTVTTCFLAFGLGAAHGFLS